MAGKQHTTRVTAGSLRYRVIKQPGEGTRPVSQRTREAIFNVLGDDLAGLSALDLFAGSGALGLEALSRGASRVMFVEKSAGVCRVIQENARELGVKARAQILQSDVDKYLGDTEDLFDIIFLDPPYADFSPDILGRSTLHLDSRGTTVVSCGKASELPETVHQILLVKQKVYGDTRIGYYKKVS